MTFFFTRNVGNSWSVIFMIATLIVIVLIYH